MGAGASTGAPGQKAGLSFIGAYHNNQSQRERMRAVEERRAEAGVHTRKFDRVTLEEAMEEYSAAFNNKGPAKRQLQRNRSDNNRASGSGEAGPSSRQPPQIPEDDVAPPSGGYTPLSDERLEELAKNAIVSRKASSKKAVPRRAAGDLSRLTPGITPGPGPGATQMSRWSSADTPSFRERMPKISKASRRDSARNDLELILRRSSGEAPAGGLKKLAEGAKVLNLVRMAVTKDDDVPKWAPPAAAGAHDLQPQVPVELRGVTVSWVIQFFYYCCDIFKTANFTIRQMVSKVILPATATLECPFSQLPGVAQAQPKAVVSCCWDAPFRDVVFNLKHDPGTAMEDGIWLDIFALGPAEAEPAARERLAAVPRAVQAAQEVLIVLDAAGRWCSQAWCLLDAYHALTCNRPKPPNPLPVGGRLRVLAQTIQHKHLKDIGEELKELSLDHAEAPVPGDAERVKEFLRSAEGGDRINEGLQGALAASLADVQPPEDLQAPISLDVADTAMLRAVLLRGMGFYPEAESLFGIALDIREARLGRNHAKVAQSLNSLANLLRARGAYGSAEPLYRRAKEIAEANYGLGHSDTFSPLFNLAELLKNMGRYEEAEPLLQECARVASKNLKSGGVSVMALLPAFISLAYILRTGGSYAEADQVLQAALEIVERQCGRQAPELGPILTSLGGLSLVMGEAAAAEQYYTLACEAFEAKGRSGVGSLMAALYNLGRTQAARQKRLEAQASLQRALQLITEKQPPTHTDVSVVAFSLITVTRAAGNHEMANKLEEEFPAANAFNISTVPLSDDSDDDLLASALQLEAKGDLQQAEEELYYLLRVTMEKLGTQSLAVARVASLLATLQTRLHKHTQAKHLHRYALEIRERRLGVNHPAVAPSLMALGAVFDGAQQWTQAKLLYVRVIQHLEAEYGEESRETAPPVRRLAALCVAQDELTDAEILYHRLLRGEPETEEEKELRLVDQERMGDLQLKLGKPGSAVVPFREVLRARERLLGQSHPDVAVLQSKLGTALLEAGSPGDALGILRGAATSLSNEGPEYAKALSSTMMGISRALSQTGDNMGSLDAQEESSTIVARMERALQVAVPRAVREAQDMELKGDHQAAEARYRQAVERIKKLDGPWSSLLPVAQQGLGQALVAQGRLEDARHELAWALAILEAERGPDHQDLVPILHLLVATAIPGVNSEAVARWRERAQALTGMRASQRNIPSRRSSANAAADFLSNLPQSRRPTLTHVAEALPPTEVLELDGSPVKKPAELTTQTPGGDSEVLLLNSPGPQQSQTEPTTGLQLSVQTEWQLSGLEELVEALGDRTAEHTWAPQPHPADGTEPMVSHPMALWQPPGTESGQSSPSGVTAATESLTSGGDPGTGASRPLSARRPSLGLPVEPSKGDGLSEPLAVSTVHSAADGGPSRPVRPPSAVPTSRPGTASGRAVLQPLNPTASGAEPERVVYVPTAPADRSRRPSAAADSRPPSATAASLAPVRPPPSAPRTRRPSCNGSTGHGAEPGLQRSRRQSEAGGELPPVRPGSASRRATITGAPPGAPEASAVSTSIVGGRASGNGNARNFRRLTSDGQMGGRGTSLPSVGVPPAGPGRAARHNRLPSLRESIGQPPPLRAMRDRKSMVQHAA